jgi:fimbrial chaperone protein
MASWRRAALVACLATLAFAAQAGQLRVGPTRIELTRQRPVGVIEVRNDNPGPVLVQIERMVWVQRNGEDSYEPTQQLIVTPPVVQLASGAMQIVRVGLRALPEDGRERAFRVYVREVPTASQAGADGIQVALRVGVPVFFDLGGPDSRLQWLIQAAESGGIRVLARNDGSHWEHVARVEARDRKSGATVWKSPQAGYLLAGGQRVWSGPTLMPVRVGDPVDLIVTTETGERRLALDVSP